MALMSRGNRRPVKVNTYFSTEFLSRTRDARAYDIMKPMSAVMPADSAAGDTRMPKIPGSFVAHLLRRRHDDFRRPATSVIIRIFANYFTPLQLVLFR